MSDGHEVVLEPLLKFQPLDKVPFDIPFEAIALTSATALSFCDLKNHLHLPVFTTGEATRKKALDYGFKNVHSANGGALELVNLIKSEIRDKNTRILYPSTQETAHDLVALLKIHKFSCINWPVYKVIESSAFSSNTLKHLEACDIDIIMLYSKRTAFCFSKLWQQQLEKTKPPPILALSKNVKSALSKNLADICIVSPEPNELSLRQLIKDKFLSN